MVSPPAVAQLQMIGRESITQEAVAIATMTRGVDPPGLPDGWTHAVKATEEPPEGLYRFWEDEPA